jgi:hypothetical protein
MKSILKESDKFGKNMGSIGEYAANGSENDEE